MNEIITHGMLKDRGNAAPITPVKQITKTYTDLPKQMPEDNLSKKEKEKLRKKR
jgi:hypothetical protein